MSIEAARLSVVVDADTSKAQKELKTVGRSVDDTATKAEKSTGRLKAASSQLGTIAAFGMGAAAGFAVSAGKKMIDAASDLAETQSKVGQIFKTSAGDMLAWGETAAQTMGMSERAALDAASSFAIMGQAAGVSGQELNTFSQNLTQLAADLGSFYNTSTQDAADAISSALRGEAEPMRRYGVLLNDATLKQAALKAGIISTTLQALTPQQKVLAAQKAIFEQTSLAQGDFARTADGFANKSKMLTATLEDLSAQMGEVLLPLVGDLADRLNALAGRREIEIVIKGAGQALGFIGEVEDFLAGGMKYAWDRTFWGQEDAPKPEPGGLPSADQFPRIKDMVENPAPGQMWPTQQTVDAMLKAYPELGEAADSAATAIGNRFAWSAGQAGAAAGIAAYKVDLLRDALGAQAEAAIASMASNLSLRDAYDQSEDSIAAYHEALKTGDWEKIDDAYRGVEHSILSVMDAAKAAGTSQIESLDALEAALGPNDPLRALIRQYRLELLKIPSEINTLLRVQTIIDGLNKKGGTRNAVQSFDTGGVVQGPFGSPQLVMAHAGETILPTHKGSYSAGGGVHVGSLIVYAETYAGGQAAARGAIDELSRHERLNGTGWRN